MSTTTHEQLAQPKRYFMRATRISEVVGDEKCDCDTPCQCVVYATDYDTLRALVDSQSAEISRLQKFLDHAIDMFDMSQSGYIPGCREDEKFQAARDQWLKDARAALHPSGERGGK